MENKINDLDTFDEITENHQLLLGEFLHKVRLEKGVELETLSKAFRVTITDLDSLEKGLEVHSKNPSLARLLANKYAAEFNVKNEEFLSLLDKAYPPKNMDFTQVIADSNITFKKDIKKTTRKRTIKRIAIYLISILFLIVLIGSLVFLLSKNLQNVNNDVINETTLLKEVALKPAKVIKEVPKTTIDFKEEISKSNGKTLVYEISVLEDPSKYTLTIEATGDCYLAVYDKNWNELEPEQMLKKGDKIELTVEDMSQVNISIGAIENVTVKVDGVDIKLKDQEKEGYYLVQLDNKAE